jgi:uncharacterized protein (TIGR03437 family)
MDAAQTNFKKIVFILAAALLLTAPFQASAQALAIGSTSIVIGSSACNQSQTITVASTSTVQFTVAINYGSGNLNGNWLYANFATNATDFGSTSGSTPITATTGPNGVQLTIGLNQGIGTATPVAYVDLTPAGGATQTITVYYTQNTSCGGNTGSVSNGFFSVSPGNIAISNSQPSQTVTIQDNIGTGFAFTPTVSPASSWLSVNASSTTVSGNGSTAITITGNANETNGVGTYNGILTITPNASGVGAAVNVPVVFTVGSGGSGGGNPTGGTLTVNNTTSNTAIITFGYVEPNVPGGQCVNLVDTASNATSYSWSTSTSSGGNWLLANNAFNGATPQNLAASYGACIQISLNPAVASNLPSGAYSGAVVVNSISGSSATINVNLYISGGVAAGVTVTAQNHSGSGAIYAFPNEAANTSFVQQETFTVSAASGYSLGSPNLAVQGGDFVLENLTANGNTLTFAVTSSSSGLAAGLYTATITVPSSYNNTSANTVITVVQPVGQSGTTATGGNTTSTTVQPTSLTFQEQANDSFWTGGQEKQALTITGASGGQWSATVVYGAGASGWLTFDSANSGTFGNGPATLLVDLFNASSLSPSTIPYQAEIDITSPSGLNQVAVSILVTPANTPVLLGLPASTTFSITSGTSTNSQSVTIVGSDNTSSTTSPPIVAGAPTATWLSATTSGNTLTLSINNTAQTTGVYSATVPITASAYSNAINYPVVLIVNGGGGGQTGGTGPLTLSSTALTYTNVTASIIQDLNVTATTSTAFTLTSSETNCNTASWLSVTNGTYQASPTTTMIPVTVNPANIANGTTCTGVITLVSTGSNGGTQTVSVSMTVAASSGSGNVTVTPTTMTFTDTIGQSAPAAQTATVANAVSGTASISFTVGTTENNGNSVTWLIASVNSAATPYNNLSISVAPGNLPAGTYTGTVTITPTGGSAETIGVTLTVNSNVTVTASPTTVSLNYTVGGTAPTATIEVSGGGAAAAFTATASSTGGWLQVTPTSGTTPNTGTSNLTVSTVATALSSLLPGSTPYTGTITVAGTSPATGTTIVNVSLTITAPLPVISGIINNASGAGGTSNVTVSPGEIISLFAPTNGQSPIGPASSVSLSSTTCPSPCTSVPTGMGGVTVTFLPGGYLAPLLYVSAGQINAVVPYEVAKIGNLSVEVKFLGQTSNAFPLTLASTAPGIYTYPSSQQAAAYQYAPNGTGSYNASSTPATAGWTLLLYVTGEGVVVPPATDGAVTVAASAPPYTPQPAAGQPTVLFNNKTPATVSFYGEAPGFVSGLMQMNVVVPPNAGTGEVPVTVTIGGNSTQAGVIVYLQ